MSLFAVWALAVLWREGSLGESLVEVVRSMVSDPALGVFLLIAAGYAFTSPVVLPTGAGLRGLLFPGGGGRRR
ncbi:hypothetical protein ABXI76_14110 [Streptomyces parvus]